MSNAQFSIFNKIQLLNLMTLGLRVAGRGAIRQSTLSWRKELLDFISGLLSAWILIRNKICPLSTFWDC